MNEGNWKEIHGCRGYFISDRGDCYSVRSNRLLKPMASESYIVYKLLPNGNKRHHRFSAGRLVLSHFGDTSKLRPFCDHIDRDHRNNHISNLRAVNRTINQLNRNTRGFSTKNETNYVNRSYKTQEGELRSESRTVESAALAKEYSEEIRARFIRDCFQEIENRERMEGVRFGRNPAWHAMFKKGLRRRGCRSMFS